ncbi:hypothetical protein MKW98_019858 [Papaver atlanticum]|uniref:Transcription initiation factor IIF subunit alpha n=1 Tax=Papaver atlanticum TaxID=357466 RepID=A0AAD4S1A1_9MAGN|nr:hypothetical protein MKW98_019858 [Papaver atlanticum]
MSFDLKLKPSCGGCGSTSDLYGSNCKHMTLCFNCGKRMTQKRAKCSDCGTQTNRLIRDDDEANEEEGGGLSKSGKELKKLLGRAAGMNDSNADDNDDEADDDMSMSQDTHTPKEELVGTPAKASDSPKRKASGDDAKVANSAPLKTVKMETGSSCFCFFFSSCGSALASKGNNAIPSSGSASSSAKAPADPCTGPVTEEEIRSVLLESAPLTKQGLMAEFRERLKSKEDKNAFAAILRRISKIQKFVVLRDNNAIPSSGSASSSAKAPADPSAGPLTEEEIRDVLLESAPLTIQGVVEKFKEKFKERLKSKEDKNAFAATLIQITKIRKLDGASYVVVRDK